MQLQVREAHEWKRVVYASDTVDIHADEHVCEPNMNADRFLKLSSEVIALCALHTSLEWLCELLKPRGELAQRARALSLEWTSPTIPLYRASRACMFILRTDARLRFSCIYFGGIRKLKVFTSSPTSVSVEGEAAHRRNAIAYVKGLAETLAEYLRPESLEYIFYSLSILVARLTCARLLDGTPSPEKIKGHAEADLRRRAHDIYADTMILRQIMCSVLHTSQRMIWLNASICICRALSFPRSCLPAEWAGTRDAVEAGASLLGVDLAGRIKALLSKKS